MNATKLIRCLLFSLVLMAFSISANAAEDVGCPSFNMANGDKHCAGKAFAIRWYKNRTLLILPLHILSPEAQYSHYVDAKDVSREVTSIDVLDLQRQSTLASSNKSLLKTGWTVGRNTGDLSGDVMAFELSNSSRLKPFYLSSTLSPVGTKVWVLTKEDGSKSLETDRFAGTVSSANPRGMVINLDRALTAISSSGSPVVNAKNELVGMMVGKKDETRMVIMAIPSPSIIRRIYNEIGQ